LGVYFLEFDLMSEDYLEHHEEVEASDELEKELQSLFLGRSVSVTAKKTVTLTYDDILKLLNDNPNLNKEEIEALLTPEFIKDKLKYMDHNYIQKMAKNLFMTYIPDNNS